MLREPMPAPASKREICFCPLSSKRDAINCAILYGVKNWHNSERLVWSSWRVVALLDRSICVNTLFVKIYLVWFGHKDTRCFGFNYGWSSKVSFVILIIKGYPHWKPRKKELSVPKTMSHPGNPRWLIVFGTANWSWCVLSVNGLIWCVGVKIFWKKIFTPTPPNQSIPAST